MYVMLRCSNVYTRKFGFIKQLVYNRQTQLYLYYVTVNYVYMCRS
jgi:hypothetical protein